MNARNPICAVTAVAAAAVLAAAGSIAVAAGPSSTNYAIPSSTINAGVGPMASANYKLNSSLGDPFFGATSSSAGYSAAAGFWPQIKGISPACILDLDGDGVIDPLTDGVMITRALLGLTGDAVTNGAIGANAQRTTWAQIQPMFHSAALDVDGNGTSDAFTDGLLIMRAMFGMTGTNVTANAVAQGAPRADWPAIRAYLNASCGTAFQ